NGYVDLSTAQTVGGAKTFTALGTFSNPSSGGGSLNIGPSSAIAANQINGAIGFWGSGVQHGELAWVPGNGFYLLDSSAGNPSSAGTIAGTRVALNAGNVNSNGTVTAPSVNGTTSLCINGDCRNSWAATQGNFISNGTTAQTANFNITGFGQFGGAIRRSSHSSGFLEGSYNNVGGNSTNTNPIYTI